MGGKKESVGKSEDNIVVIIFSVFVTFFRSLFSLNLYMDCELLRETFSFE